MANATNAVSAVKDLLTGKGQTPAAWPNLLGTPVQFVTQFRQYVANHAIDFGLPNLLGSTGLDPKQSSDYTGVELYGIVLNAGVHRRTPANRLQILCKLSPQRPGPDGPVSHISFRMIEGKYTAEIAQQVAGFEAYLRGNGYLE
jgi:hypothetical protein